MKKMLSCNIILHNEVQVKYGTMQKIINIINTLKPPQNGNFFADDIFKYFFLNKNFKIATKFSLSYVALGIVENKPALVNDLVTPNRWQTIAWSYNCPVT